MLTTDAKRALVEVILRGGYMRLEEPVRLSSGATSLDYVDGKRAFARGPDLRAAGEAMAALAAEEGWEFDAVGGLTLGADHFSHAIALVADRSWFVVRKQEKGHGTRSRIEGTRLGAGVRAMLVDDVVTTGGSILAAHDSVRATGAEVVGVTTMVDRGTATADAFADRGVPYRAVLTFADLGIDPVGP